MFQGLEARGFEIMFLSHAQAILSTDFPQAIDDLNQSLAAFSIPLHEIVGSGGGETQGTQRLRRALAALGWHKVNFEIKKTINGIERESISHEVDHVKTFAPGNVVALEIEWNNKDPFFDRDLENFKRLHTEGAISVGVIVTRGSTLQDRLKDFVFQYAMQANVQSFNDLARLGLNMPTERQRGLVEARAERSQDTHAFARAWSEVFVSDKYGAATTHWTKLMARVTRGVGNPCPLLLIGLPDSIIVA